MTKPRVIKSAKIPKVGTAARKKLLEIITEMLLYKTYIDKGRRFFLKERLVEIEETYKESGLSWKEIDTTVSEQGLTITQATFRKYLREELIPKAFTYKKTTSGRTACYDASIISHINLVLFLFNVPSSYIDEIIDDLNYNEITAKEAIESKLSEENLYPAIFRDLYQNNNGSDVSSEISEVLKRKHPEAEAKAQKLYADIKDIFDKQLAPKIDELIKYLNNYHIVIHDMVDTEKLLHELEEL